MPGGGHVDADLVGAAGFQVHLDEAGLAKGLDEAVMGDRGFAIIQHGEFPARFRVPADGSIDGAFDRIGQALDHRVIGLFHGAGLKCLLERRVGAP